MTTSLQSSRWLLPLALFSLTATQSFAADAPGRWPVDKANAWLEKSGWLRGGNFLPSTAVNQLEMWQADTFDEATIDRELGYAEALGLNSMRVFLHDLPWKDDKEGFCKRIERFLDIAEKHKVGILFVIFDSCWHPVPKSGKQPAPLPHVHNSYWVQSPGAEALSNPAEYPRLQEYVTGVIKRFANDPRINGWDMWNEPENNDGGAVKRPGLDPKNKVDLMLALMPKVFQWARDAKPTQPLTSGVWMGDYNNDEKMSPTHRVQFDNSDVISFHHYGKIDAFKKNIEGLKRFSRPILCTEYMARGENSFFDPHMGYMKEQKVAAYCWGFIAGKSQTNYPWDSWTKEYKSEPALWFHDILRPNGVPYRAEEAAYITRLTGAADPHTSPAPKGSYHNPVLRGDYPDPSVIRVGDDYYASATASEWGPQFPILHSKDLVNWSIIGTIFKERPSWSTVNYWAPEICAWKGKYYVYYVGRKKDGPLAVAVATADKPEGPWTDHGPMVWQDAGSIDGFAIDDEKGQRWLVWKEDGNSKGKPTPIWAQRLDETGTKLVGDMHELLRNDATWEGNLVEGPFILRRGDWFYMFYAANACCGRGCSYGTGVARSKTLLGPWEKHPQNPILATNTQFRGPGHGSIVDDPQGRLWFLYHAYDLQSFIYTGREMMLDEVTFGKDGWPVINNGKGASSLAKGPANVEQKRAELVFVDEFKNAELTPGWQWPVGHPPTAKIDAANGGQLVLQPGATKPSNEMSAVLARSCTSGSYQATTAIDPSQLKDGNQAGISAFGDPGNAFGLSVGNGSAVLWRVEKGRRAELAKQDGLPAGPVQIRMTAPDARHFQFAFSTDGKEWTKVGSPVDGDYLPPWDRSIRVALVAGGNEARFDYLKIEPLK